MRVLTVAAFALAGACLCFGQLTTEQKISDFNHLSGLFIKGYGPYDWKKNLYRFDLADTEPWLAKVRASKSDLEFYEIMHEYTASLDDAHVVYLNPSTYRVDLNFRTDIYDGKLLVDSINRTRLPASEYPFAIGYELVSIDGEDATSIMNRLTRYAKSANIRTTERTAASYVTVRGEWFAPSEVNVPEMSTVVFRRFDGKLETHRIPWARSGMRLPGNGKLPNGASARGRVPSAAAAEEGNTGEDSVVAAVEPPEYMKPLLKLWNTRLPDRRSVLNIGTVTPVFARGLPGTFVQRLGRLQSDFFYSGTYTSEGLRIGFIRIPTYAPSDDVAALLQFAREVQYMQENTDGLVIDQMRNPGGFVHYQHALLSYLFHYQWRSMPFEVRATSVWVSSISTAYEQAKTLGAPADILTLLEHIMKALQEANRSDRGMTEPIPLDDVKIMRDPVKDNRGNLLGYTKPLIVLADELSASGADAFAAVIQDNGRGPVFGWRTMGAGGNVTQWGAGSYSEGTVTLTESLMSRATERAEVGYPVSRYIENVGVHPDIENDYMTRRNLNENGRPYVEAFTAAIVDWIRKHQ